MSDTITKRHWLDPKTPVTHSEATGIAERFIAKHFGNSDKEYPRVSIPLNLERDDDVRLMAYIRQNERLEVENKRLRAALEWYAEQARLCRLIHSEGDAGRHSLAADGGDRAALEPQS